MSIIRIYGRIILFSFSLLFFIFESRPVFISRGIILRKILLLPQFFTAQSFSISELMVFFHRIMSQNWHKTVREGTMLNIAAMLTNALFSHKLVAAVTLE